MTEAKNTMNLYHGTTLARAKKIQKNGFKQGKPNWQVPSRPGFVYLSTAYAPFFAMYADKRSDKGALVRVEVDPKDLYPDDDWLMLALGKPVYTTEELLAVDPEEYKNEENVQKSLKALGSVAVKIEDVRVVGIQPFDMKRLLFVCDPCITPMNYLIMGAYYRSLSDHIYETGSIEAFDSGENNPLKA